MHSQQGVGEGLWQGGRVGRGVGAGGAALPPQFFSASNTNTLTDSLDSTLDWRERVVPSQRQHRHHLDHHPWQEYQVGRGMRVDAGVALNQADVEFNQEKKPHLSSTSSCSDCEDGLVAGTLFRSSSGSTCADVDAHGSDRDFCAAEAAAPPTYDLLALTAESNFNGAAYPLDVVQHVTQEPGNWVPRDTVSYTADHKGALLNLAGLDSEP